MSEQTKMQEIDFNDINLDLENDTLDLNNINPEEDAWKDIPPVPDGVRLYKLTLGKVQSGETKDKEVFYMVNLVAKVIEDPDYEGFVIFDSPSTIIPRGRSTNAMVGILYELGIDIRKDKSINTKAKLAKRFKDEMIKEPTLKAQTEWIAQKVTEDKNGKKTYRTIMKGMDRFPKDKDGKPIPIVSDKDGDWKAQARVVRWIGPHNPLWDGQAKSTGASVGPTLTLPKGPVMIDG